MLALMKRSIRLDWLRQLHTAVADVLVSADVGASWDLCGGTVQHVWPEILVTYQCVALFVALLVECW